jgi:hypothetical protein
VFVQQPRLQHMSEAAGSGKRLFAGNHNCLPIP